MDKENKEYNLGITLVALIVTIIILLILAGISIASLTENGLFEKSKLAKEKQKNSQIEENIILSGYENEIGEYIDGNRETISKKQILWKTEKTGLREVQLDVNVKDYDFLIVYYRAANSSGDIVFDTSENAEYATNYTISGYYTIGAIALDINLNNIKMSVTSNDTSFANQTYLTKIIGIKL